MPRLSAVGISGLLAGEDVKDGHFTLNFRKGDQRARYQSSAFRRPLCDQQQLARLK